MDRRNPRGHGEVMHGAAWLQSADLLKCILVRGQTKFRARTLQDIAQVRVGARLNGVTPSRSVDDHNVGRHDQGKLACFQAQIYKGSGI